MEDLLEISLEDLLDIEVISATKRVQKIAKVPANIRVVTSEDIADRGYLTLEDIVRDQPGFNFRNIQGFNSYIFLRGVPNQNNLILVLVDGIQINELNSGGFYGGGQFNLSNIERVEIVYGPASALYGTNALSGIINIITKRPSSDPGIDVNVYAGGFKTGALDLSYSYYDEISDLGFRVSAMSKYSEKADLAGAAGDNNWTDDMENFEVDKALDIMLTYKGLTASWLFQDKQASRTTNYRTIDDVYQDHGSNWHILFNNGYVKYQHDLNPKLDSESILHYRQADVADNTIGYIKQDSIQGQVAYYRPNNLFGFEEKLHYVPNEKIQVVTGFVIEEEHLADGFSKAFSGSPDIKPETPIDPPTTNNQLLSAYIQIQYEPVSDLEFTGGLRTDKSSVYDVVNTPRLGVVYNKNKLTLKLLYMEAFRAPKPWDYTWGVGNPNLNPEEMSSSEMILIYHPTKQTRYDITYYHNKIEQLFEKEDNKWVNGGNLLTDGIEVTANTQFKNSYNYLNLTYLDSRSETEEQISEISPWSMNGGTKYSFSKNFYSDISFNYYSERKNPQTITQTGSEFVDAALVLHATVTHKNLWGTRMQLGIHNLMDTEYYHTSNRPPERYRQAQRTWYIRCSTSF